MAYGDVLGIAVQSSGWHANVTIDDFVEGADYEFGDSYPGGASQSSCVTLNVTAPGFDAAGNPTTVTDTIYAGSIRNRVFPNHAELEEDDSSGDLVASMFFRDSAIYESDTVAAATFGVFCTDTAGSSGSNNSVQFGPEDPITNSSTRRYSPPISRWLQPPYYAITDTLTLRVVVADKFARNRKPVACVIFTATDGTTPLSATVSTPSKWMMDANGLVLWIYEHTFSTSSWTQGATITAHYKACPHRGTRALDSSRSYFLTSDADAASLTPGETITQATSLATARVVSVSGSGPYEVVIDNLTESNSGTPPNASNDWTGGTSSAVVTPSTAPWWTGFASAHSRHVGPLTFICDKNGAYGESMAYVDPNARISTNSDFGALQLDETITQAVTGATARVSRFLAVNAVDVTEVTGTPNSSDDWTSDVTSTVFTPTTVPVNLGNDGTGVVATVGSPAAAYAAPFRTMGAAETALAAYNNANFGGRNNCGNSYIQLSDGRHLFGGAGAGGAGNVPAVWLTITRRPDRSKETTRIVGRASSFWMSCPRVRIYDVTLSQPSSSVLGAMADYRLPLLIENCNIIGNPSNNTTLFSDGHRWYVGNTITSLNRIGADGTNGRTLVAIDNTFTDTDTNQQIRLVIGNRVVRQKASASGYCFLMTEGDNIICAHNEMFGCNGGALQIGTTGHSMAHGFADIGNIKEYTGAGTTPVSQLFDFGAYPTCNNGISIFNTSPGERTNINYSEGGTNVRLGWVVKYNLCESLYTKHDPFSENGTHIGSHEFAYAVGCRGNVSLRSPDNFIPFYIDQQSARAIEEEVIAWTLDASKTGTNEGGGDYRPAGNSAARNRVLAGDVPWGCDLYGTDIPENGSGCSGGVQIPEEVDSSYRGGARNRSRSRARATNVSDYLVAS